jgi:hypothetical protein
MVVQGIKIIAEVMANRIAYAVAKTSGEQKRYPSDEAPEGAPWRG